MSSKEQEQKNMEEEEEARSGQMENPTDEHPSPAFEEMFIPIEATLFKRIIRNTRFQMERKMPLEDAHDVVKFVHAFVKHRRGDKASDRDIRESIKVIYNRPASDADFHKWHETLRDCRSPKDDVLDCCSPKDEVLDCCSPKDEPGESLKKKKKKKKRTRKTRSGH
ncbi:hypothetical protein X975_00981, partial [Stegodyphus mimosarum]